MQRYSHREILKNSNRIPENEKLRVVQYVIVKVDEKNHSQSIYLEDSTVVFELSPKADHSDSIKEKNNVILTYDKFGVSKVAANGGFSKGQTWQFFFNKQKILMKISLVRKKKMNPRR